MHHGGGGSGATAAPKWAKKDYTIPIYVAAGVFAFCAVSFVIIMLTVPMYIGDTCDDITNVSVGTQPSFRFPRVIGEEGAYFHARNKNVTAYWFWSNWAYFECKERYKTFEYEERVRPNSYSVYSVGTSCWGYESSMYFDYELSFPADVYVFTQDDYEIFQKTGRVSNYTWASFATTSAKHEFDISEKIMHVVINNEHDESIKVTENGWASVWVSALKEEKALYVCNGSCYINYPVDMIVFIDYTGNERTVPVTLLQNSEFNPLLIALIAIFGAGTLISGITLISFLASRKVAPGEIPPPSSSPQTSTPTPSVNYTPGSFTSESVSIQGSAPPSYGNDMGISASPTNTSVSETAPLMGSAPTDIYGIPMTF